MASQEDSGPGEQFDCTKAQVDSGNGSQSSGLEPSTYGLWEERKPGVENMGGKELITCVSFNTTPIDNPPETRCLSLHKTSTKPKIFEMID